MLSLSLKLLKSVNNQTLRSMSSCIGIVREKFSKWERRVPLTPSQVDELVNKQGIRVLVEPSNKRIFTNEEYEEVGGELTSDLGDANLIVGVKQVPVENILENKDYLFFSHVIKAQEENMALLDRIVGSGGRLFDYECINEGGKRDRPRLVAFGRFAGLVGMVNSLQALGQAYLAQGVSTPFLHCPLTYTQPTLDGALESVRRVGESILQIGLPEEISPVIVLFTGNGNVSKGAQEVFEQLPHEYIQAKDLPDLRERIERGEVEGWRNKMFGVVAESEDMVERLDGQPFVEKDYFADPSPTLYKPTFHERVLPFISSLVNCMYWDYRFPRLITTDHMSSSFHPTSNKLKVVADISCDVGGSVEFLTHTTTTDDPFFTFNPRTGESEDGIQGEGIVMMGVDILPAELPKEASQHFGQALLPLLPSLATLDQEGNRPSITSLPHELQTSCIVADGSLTPDYQYISTLREKREEKTRSSLEEKDGEESTLISELPICKDLLLRGHIFDSGLINQSLDLVEREKGSFLIGDIIVSPKNISDQPIPTSLFFKLCAKDQEHLGMMISKLETLVSAVVTAEASISEVHSSSISVTQESKREEKKKKQQQLHISPVSSQGKVLLLGSGLVASPVVSYFASIDSSCPSQLTIATNDLPSAVSILNKMENQFSLEPSIFHVDASSEQARIDQLVSEHDVVISLLPAHMHLPIARSCLASNVPLVTASYISEEMKLLDEEAREKRIPILNEMGLDPGMDHLAIMEAVDELKEEGFDVVEMTSLCGGLPAPESAEENPLRYKFSWSPLGVLKAAQNSAKFRMNGEITEIPSQDLLQSAQRCEVFPTLNLEVLPNRDSIAYGDVYGISDTVQTLFRGTLRYEGWSQIMHSFFKSGLLRSDEVEGEVKTWGDLMEDKELSDSHVEFSRALEFLSMTPTSPLPPTSSNSSTNSSISPLSLTCGVMGRRMGMEEGERDLVAMSHRIVGRNQTTNQEKTITSSLLLEGKDDGTTAMARTVGLTCAIGADLILRNNGRSELLNEGGILSPIHKDIYQPALQLLEEQGIKFRVERKSTTQV